MLNILKLILHSLAVATPELAAPCDDGSIATDGGKGATRSLDCTAVLSPPLLDAPQVATLPSDFRAANESSGQHTSESSSTAKKLLRLAAMRTRNIKLSCYQNKAYSLQHK